MQEWAGTARRPINTADYFNTLWTTATTYVADHPRVPGPNFEQILGSMPPSLTKTDDSVGLLLPNQYAMARPQLSRPSAALPADGHAKQEIVSQHASVGGSPGFDFDAGDAVGISNPRLPYPSHFIFLRTERQRRRRPVLKSEEAERLWQHCHRE